MCSWFMFTFLLLSVMVLLLTPFISSMQSDIDRMSMAFGVTHKPYTPVTKPKTTRPKIVQDLFALVKYAGTGAIGISGKIAGTVFTTAGSNGAFIRVWAKPRNVRNALTQGIRGLFAGISTSWKSLTPSQISAWNQAAVSFQRSNVFGDVKNLKGSTAYQRVNNIFTSLGIANISDPPAIVGTSFAITAAVASADVSSTSFGIVITDFFGGVVLGSNTYIKVYATSQRPSSQSYFGKSAYRYIGFAAPTDSTNPLDIYADYIARFGLLQAGARVSVAMEVISANASGIFQKSGLFYTDCVITA